MTQTNDPTPLSLFDIHELLLCCGYTIKYPPKQTGVRDIDYIVCQDNSKIACVEVTTMEFGRNANRRYKLFSDFLNQTFPQIKSSSYQLHAEIIKSNSDTPSAKRFASKLNTWLDGLNYDEIDTNRKQGIEYPEYIYKDKHGWEIEVAIGGHKNKPCDISSGYTTQYSFSKAIKTAITEKVSQYNNSEGVKDLPFIVALCPRDRARSIPELGLMNALFGTICHPVSNEGWREPYREANGVLTRSGKFRDKPDAVITVSTCDPYILDEAETCLYVNPYSEHRDILPSWPMKRVEWNKIDGNRSEVDGKCANDILKIPNSPNQPGQSQ